MTSGATFRAATIGDIPAMSAVRLAVKENVLSNPARITREMYADHVNGRGRSWVCEVEGEIVGFSSADGENASIWALFVHPSHESRGLGKNLLRLATDWLFSLGKREIVLSTEAGTRADRFYEAQGWERGEMQDRIEVIYRLRA